ncbi:hypothetical protein I7I48_11040 [Histoplasma ohiense]|nr:hypothetical protein I7I48_11040 [Histoplasma ohiense (nom. inval.)]
MHNRGWAGLVQFRFFILFFISVYSCTWNNLLSSLPYFPPSSSSFVSILSLSFSPIRCDKWICRDRTEMGRIEFYSEFLKATTT